MSAEPTFLLAFDHRNSYEKALPDTSPEQLRDGKVLVVEALNKVAAERGANAGAGLLTDPVYGSEALVAADGTITALAIERSGQAIFEVERDDYLAMLDELDPTYAKVLIRFRADDPDEERNLQLERLREVNDALKASGRGFLLEIITPFTDDEAAAAEDDLDAVRLPLMSAAITALIDGGLDPEIWKVEGLDNAESCQAIVDQCRAKRADVGVVVLGAGAPTVDRWLAASAKGGYTGFAVGRSIWKEPLVAWRAGTTSRDEAIAEVATRYAGFIDAFNAAV